MPENEPHVIRLYTTAEAANMLNIKIRALQALCRGEKIEYVQISQRERRFTLEQINDYIERQSIRLPNPVDSRIPRKVELPCDRRAETTAGDIKTQLRKELASWR